MTKSNKQREILDALSARGNSPFFDDKHQDLYKHVCNHMDPDQTEYLWSEIERLIADKHNKSGEREVSHRLSFVILKSPANNPLSLCTRHLRFFDSGWRYLKSRSLHLSGTCPLCDAETANKKVSRPGVTAIQLDDLLAEAEVGYRIDFSKITIKDRYRVWRTIESIPTICMKPKAIDREGGEGICGTRKEQRVNNLSTLIKGKETRTIKCLGPCHSSNRIIQRRIARATAQNRLDQFASGYTIDRATYNTYTDKCIIEHDKCGQKHWVTPQAFVISPQCIRCYPDKRQAWMLVPDLESYDSWLRFVSNRELDPEHLEHNQFLFSKRDALAEEETKIKIRCKNHNAVKMTKRVGHAHRTRGEGCCREAAKESKRKYTVRYLKENILPENITIDCIKSGIDSIDDHIVEDKLLDLVCDEHGALDQQYTTFQLARIKSYKTDTFCLKCDPLSNAALSPSRVRHYVEHEDRIRTHGAVFTLVTEDEELKRQIDAAKAKGLEVAKHLNILIECLSQHKVLDPGSKVPITYQKFMKGSVGRSDKNDLRSWLQRLIELICTEWEIAYETEVTFEGLINSKYNTLYCDIVFRSKTMIFVLEVDGPQHVSQKHQIPFTSTPTEALEKLKEIQENDRCKNEYFKNRPGYKFIRLNAFKQIEGSVRQLTISESFDIALAFCSEHFPCPHPEGSAFLNKHRFINASIRSEITKRKSRVINAIYNGHFSVIRYDRSSISRRGESVILHCLHNHFIDIGFSTCHFHKGKIEKGADVETFCWGCCNEKKIESIAKECAACYAILVDYDIIRQKFLGTRENPVNKEIPSYYKIKILNTVAGNTVVLTVAQALTPGKIQKVLSPPPVRQRRIKEVTRATPVPVRHERSQGSGHKKDGSKTVVAPAKKDKPIILNKKELERGRDRAKAYNACIQKGIPGILPVLPVVNYEGSVIPPFKPYDTVADRIAGTGDFELLTERGQVWAKESFVALRHSCGEVSFHRLDILLRNKPILCQGYKCYHAHLSDIRTGSVPGNKKTDLCAEIIDASEKFLELVHPPKDVRSPFIARIQAGILEGKYIRVSCHSNWMRRGNYRQLAEACRGSGKLPRRLEFVSVLKR